MAFCRLLTSAEGPVIRDVPVSTMASQPLLHRFSWVPTASLSHTNMHMRVSAFQLHSDRQHRCHDLSVLGVTFELSPIHVDLPVGLAGDVDVVEVTAVVFGVGSSQQQLTSGLGVWVPDKEERGLVFHDGIKPYR